LRDRRWRVQWSHCWLESLPQIRPCHPMASLGSELPREIEACHVLINRLQKDLRQQVQAAGVQQATIDQQQVTIDHLAAEMALLKRALFGSRRERFRGDDPDQQYLFDSKELQAEAAEPEPQVDDQQVKSPRTSKGRGRRVFPEVLPRKEVRHKLRADDIPEDLRDDPTAKRFFKKTSEELEYVPPFQPTVRPLYAPSPIAQVLLGRFLLFPPNVVRQLRPRRHRRTRRRSIGRQTITRSLPHRREIDAVQDQ